MNKLWGHGDQTNRQTISLSLASHDCEIYIYPFMVGVIGYIYSCLTDFSSLFFLTLHFSLSAFPVHTSCLFSLFIFTLMNHTFLRSSIYFLFIFILLGHFLFIPRPPPPFLIVSSSLPMLWFGSILLSGLTFFPSLQHYLPSTFIWYPVPLIFLPCIFFPFHLLMFIISTLLLLVLSSHFPPPPLPRLLLRFLLLGGGGFTSFPSSQPLYFYIPLLMPILF